MFHCYHSNLLMPSLAVISQRRPRNRSNMTTHLRTNAPLVTILSRPKNIDIWFFW